MQALRTLSSSPLLANLEQYWTFGLHCQYLYLNYYELSNN